MRRTGLKDEQRSEGTEMVEDLEEEKKISKKQIGKRSRMERRTAGLKDEQRSEGGTFTAHAREWKQIEKLGGRERK